MSRRLLRFWVLLAAAGVLPWTLARGPLLPQDKPPEEDPKPLLSLTNDDIAPSSTAGGRSSSEGLTAFKKGSETGAAVLKLINACFYGKFEVVRQLVEHGVPVNAYCHDPVVFTSPTGGPIRVPVSATSPPTDTPLMNAVTAGRAAIAAYLVAHGADVSARIIESYTVENGVQKPRSFASNSAFHTACGYDRVDVVEALLKGNPTDQAFSDGLGSAAVGDHLEVLRVLLNYRVDPAAIANALHLIRGNAHPEARRLLEGAR